MKKVKLVGALLAAVIAAAPATGLTSSVLSFNDNAIVAEAAGVPNGPDEFWGPDRFPSLGQSTYTISSEGNSIFFANATTPIMVSDKNKGTHIGQKGLFLLSNGTLVVRNRAGYPGNWWWETRGQKVIFAPKYKNYTRCMLAMQWDGNFVIYNNHDYRFPIYYCGAQPHYAYNGNKYTFTLTSSGQVKIAYNGIVCKTIG